MEKIDEVLIRLYGNRIKEHLEEIKRAIDVVVCAKVYTGDQGDNPLCRLNRIIAEITKEQ